jgi:hypothetical protein
MSRLAAVAVAVVVGLASRTAPGAEQAAPPPWHGATPTARLGGKELRLDAFLWRDFMPMSIDPGTPPEALRRGLLASVQLRALDGSAVPQGLQIEGLWVVQGDEVWAAPTTEQYRWASGEAYGVVARQGPTWEPGTFADVFARARDAAGQSALLVIRAQRIGATH